jgi:large subunit ribosomal protein L19
MANPIVDAVETQYLKKQVPEFAVGDTVDVQTRIVEGEKERLQTFSGTVIARKGKGINETFIVRRIVNNEGVERIFPTHSPFIANITVKRSGQSRRAKLFYLRKRVGKAVRLVEKDRKKKTDGPAANPAQPAAAAATPALATSAS